MDVQRSASPRKQGPAGAGIGTVERLRRLSRNAARVRRARAAPQPATPTTASSPQRAGNLRWLRQQSRHWMMSIGAVDAMLLAAAVGVAAQLRYPADAAAYATAAENLFWRAALFAAAIVLSMFALGVYQPHSRETAKALLVRQAVAFAMGTLLLTMLYYVVPQAYIGRGVLALAFALGLVAVAAWHVVAGRLMDAESLNRRILIFCAGHGAAFVAQWMSRRCDWRTASVVGFVPVPGESVKIAPDRLVDVGATALHEWAAGAEIDEIVVVPDDRRGRLPMDELLECKQRGIEVTDLVRFMERESGRVKLSAPPSWLVFSDGFHASPLRLASKRAFDILSATILLALAWPFMLLVALAIRLESGPGQPILYSQERVGERGRVFRLYKFR